MPLPEDGVWPPASYRGHYDDQREASAWYSGDTSQIAAYYGSAAARAQRPSERVRFWARRQDTATQRDRQRIHIPAAGDIAATSADLLFGEPVEIRMPEDADTALQDRVVQLVEEMHLHRLLLEAAEIAAGVGGVYLRVGWDLELDSARPLLDVVHGDRAVPEFRRGRLAAVTFWTTLYSDSQVTMRHLERHEPGVVLHGLYAGNHERLGQRVSLERHPATAGLADEVPNPEGIAGLLVRYVPNQLPNRKRRGEPIGRADCSGAESLMDGLDETFTSWMRDIRLGQSRIVVPHSWLTRVERGSGATFDVDREVFTGLDVDPLSQQGGASITPVEFKLRTEEHAVTALALFERIVTTSGYSPQTFGLHNSESGDMTATEVRSRSDRSLSTKARKERYWGPALADAVELLLAVDKAMFRGKGEPVRPIVSFQDGMVEDPARTATTIDLLARAQAISIETRVRMAQPDWDQDEVDAEVLRIKDEQSITVPDPTGGLA